MKYVPLQSTRKVQSTSNQGSLLVEVILAISIFVLFTTAFAGVYLYGQESSLLSGARTRAVLLAHEGLEVVRNIRDEGTEGSFSTLAAGTYGIAVQGGQWILSGSSDITGIFTRQLTVTDVDASRKDITATITWQQNAQRSGSLSLTTRLTDWMEVVSVAGNWTLATTTASIDIEGGQNGWKVATEGDYAYVIRNGGGDNFVVIDVSNPDSPSIESETDFEGILEDVFVSGSYAYIVGRDNQEEFQVIDISDPSDPELIGSYNAPGNANMKGVYVVGNTAYAVRNSSGQDEFYVINVSAPASPVLLGSINLGSTGNEVYVNGSHAYVASDSNSQELQVVDISVPASPTLVATLDLNSNDNADTIAGSGATIVIGRVGNTGRVHVIDISSPLNPSEYGSTYIAGDDVRDVAFVEGGSYVLLATDDNNAEFQVMDISNPSNPIRATSLDISGDANGVTYSSEFDRAFIVGDANDAEFRTIAPQ